MLVIINETIDKLKHENYDLKTNINNTIATAIDYINNNIEKPLTVSQIAHDLFLSPTYLSHLFHKEMNISIKKYNSML